MDWLLLHGVTQAGLIRNTGLIAIKPSGVEYEKMTAGKMVIALDLNGKVVEGQNRPSSDTPTHIELYKAFDYIGGITHSHSEYATIFAQACKGIPCFGTTHADHFNGTVPVTRYLSEIEVKEGYEYNTGKVIIERFKGSNATAIPAVLIAGHAPFTWGKN